MSDFFFRYFITRTLCLIAILIMFHLAMSKIHFAILWNPESGDAIMSGEFEPILDGNGWILPMRVISISSFVYFLDANRWLTWFSFRRYARSRSQIYSFPLCVMSG